MLQKSAPEGVRTALVPSRELREEWRERRLTQDFWGKAFQNAKPLKPAATPAVPPENLPAPTVAQAA